jgi:hypothetical protein
MVAGKKNGQEFIFQKLPGDLVPRTDCTFDHDSLIGWSENS